MFRVGPPTLPITFGGQEVLRIVLPPLPLGTHSQDTTLLVGGLADPGRNRIEHVKI